VSAHVLDIGLPDSQVCHGERTWIVESSNACVGATTPEVTSPTGASRHHVQRLAKMIVPIIGELVHEFDPSALHRV